MIGLITFIKAYKLAFASVNEKISGWDKVFLDGVNFPGNDYTPNDRIIFIFSNSSTTNVGSLCVSVAVNIEAVEHAKNSDSDCLYNNHILKEHCLSDEVAINYVGKILFTLSNLVDQITRLDNINISNIKLSSIEFNSESNLVTFYLMYECAKLCISTDGKLFMFGD